MQTPQYNEVLSSAKPYQRRRICVCCGEQMKEEPGRSRNPNLCGSCIRLVDDTEDFSPLMDPP